VTSKPLPRAIDLTMNSRICVSIAETTSFQVVEAVARAAEWADLIEIRADAITDLDINFSSLFQNHSKPIIFTLRSRAEGGAYSGSERKRMETILQAARSGADYVDIEFSASWQLILQSVPHERVILSCHFPEGTPEGLIPLADEMAASGAGILKIAVRAQSLEDNLRIKELLEHGRERDFNLCALAMGREGIPSRILGPCWGSWMTFASMPGSDATAEGQLPADVLVQQYRIREIKRESSLYGVVGNPLEHSLSPRIHNAAFAARGTDAVMIPLEAANFEDFLKFQASALIRGVAVTIPYKAEAHALAHSLSVAAEQTGAVNTLMVKERGWHGENTDVEGFLIPLKRRVRPGRLRTLVLGAGGAARAVIYALRSEGAEVVVAARDVEKARPLVGSFQVQAIPWEKIESQHWDLLVNATPIGMYPEVDRSPVPADLLKGEWVYDLVYNPAETRLLKDAARKGCKTIAGGEMFLAQAWKQQLLWCGTPPPEDVMETTLLGAFA
jgi:3-dehydroquinate dehydratase / shikimate dehydrogenase